MSGIATTSDKAATSYGPGPKEANMQTQKPTRDQLPNWEGTDNWGVPESVRNHPYFVEVENGSIVDALMRLDEKMRSANDHRLVSRKKPHSLFGRTVQVGQVGMWSWRGRPMLTIKPGNYWNFSWAHSYCGKTDVTEPIDFMGLTCGQVGQSSAMVVEDPQNKVFVIRNGGFAAYGTHGRFRILDIVDTLALGDKYAIRERNSNAILGWKREVTRQDPQAAQRRASNVARQNVVVATFLNIPANNVAIVQRGNNLLQLEAGQHVITDPKTTFRQFFSLGERQVKIKTEPAYTIEGVPVTLNVNLRYRVLEPLILSRNYEDAFQALANPAQTAVNSVVSRLSYQQFMRAKKLSGDIPDTDIVSWLEHFKAECQQELSAQASSYGVKVESFDVLDRELEGALGKDLERQAEQVLRNQMEATQVELQNQIKRETQRGKLEIAKVQAQQTQTEADAGYYAATRVTDAKCYEALQEAKAAAEASQVRTEQDAKNLVALADANQYEIGVLARAYGAVQDDHARAIQMANLAVARIKAMPEKTVYISGGAGETGVMNGLATGYALSAGAKYA